MSRIRDIVAEVVIRIALFSIFLYLEYTESFQRKVLLDELWLYKYPRTASYVPSAVMFSYVFATPLCIFLVYLLVTKDKLEFTQSVLSVSLAIALNGVITNSLKCCIGRPRPDFFWRCFPDGETNSDMECTGDKEAINDGRKSFPSGHSSFTFVSMGFVAFYLMGKLHVLSERGRGQTWRFLISIMPLFFGLLVAVSRTCDYHHHWQDVTVGSTIGLILSYVCYRQYYPALDSPMSHQSYAATTPVPIESNEPLSSEQSSELSNKDGKV